MCRFGMRRVPLAMSNGPSRASCGHCVGLCGHARHDANRPYSILPTALPGAGLTAKAIRRARPSIARPYGPMGRHGPLAETIHRQPILRSANKHKQTQTNTNKHTSLCLRERTQARLAAAQRHTARRHGRVSCADWKCGWRSGTAAVLRHWDGAGGYCALTVLCSTLTGAGGRGMPWSAASH